MTDRKLRISHLIIQAALVWDDGEELTPGPELQPVQMPLSSVPGFIDTLPEEVASLSERLQEESE
jgi:hypothetical protein